jgi:NAD(P)H dehydrogenase (quinone)
MAESAKKFLVTGATGRTGGHTVRQLRERGAPVRALVHREDQRSAALSALGAEVVVGDMLSLASMTEATRGIAAAYFTYPVNPGLMEATAIFAHAAAESGVGAVVNMSQRPARPDAPSDASRQHWLSERVLDWSPVPVTHLRPTLFAEWLLRFYWPDGTLRLPFSEESRHAPIAAEDQARVITAILDDPAPHAGQVYPLFGAEAIDHRQIAREMSRALGKTVTYTPTGVDEFIGIMRDQGFSEQTVQHLGAIVVDYRNGIFDGNNDVVKTIGGQEPQSVREFVARNKHQFDAKSAR